MTARPASPGDDFTIIKVGGSILFSDQAQQWLKAIANLTNPVTLVTGGGKIVDAVRDMQTRLSFSEETAHTLAMMGMTMSAFGINDCDEKFSASTDEQDMLNLMQEGRILYSMCRA